MQIARSAPLELVRHVLDALLDQRIRRLDEKEHDERLAEAEREGRLDDAGPEREGVDEGSTHQPARCAS